MRPAWPSLFAPYIAAALLFIVAARSAPTWAADNAAKNADTKESSQSHEEAELSQDFLEFLAEFSDEKGQIDLPDTDTVTLVNDETSADAPDDEKSQDEKQRRIQP